MNHDRREKSYRIVGGFNFLVNQDRREKSDRGEKSYIGRMVCGAGVFTSAFGKHKRTSHTPHEGL